MVLSSKTKVAVLRGGSTPGYEESLKSGQNVLKTLREMPETYEPFDIFISKDGDWHLEGLVREPHETLRHADVVWNALHGPSGEEEHVQKLLQSMRLPFTGSSALASVLATNREMAGNLYRNSSLLTPAYELITEDNFNQDRLIEIFRNYLPPVRVGTTLVYSFQELERAIKDALNNSQRVVIEEYIKGNDVSCTVVRDAKGERIYAFIPCAKSVLKAEESKQIAEIAKRAHEVLGLSHYSSSDFVVTPRKKVYILGTNPHPPLHEESVVHQSLLSTGWKPKDFIHHVLQLAL